VAAVATTAKAGDDICASGATGVCAPVCIEAGGAFPPGCEVGDDADGLQRGGGAFLPLRQSGGCAAGGAKEGGGSFTLGPAPRAAFCTEFVSLDGHGVGAAASAHGFEGGGRGGSFARGLGAGEQPGRRSSCGTACGPDCPSASGGGTQDSSDALGGAALVGTSAAAAPGAGCGALPGSSAAFAATGSAAAIEDGGAFEGAIATAATANVAVNAVATSAVTATMRPSHGGAFEGPVAAGKAFGGAAAAVVALDAVATSVVATAMRSSHACGAHEGAAAHTAACVFGVVAAGRSMAAQAMRLPLAVGAGVAGGVAVGEASGRRLAEVFGLGSGEGSGAGSAWASEAIGGEETAALPMSLGAQTSDSNIEVGTGANKYFSGSHPAHPSCSTSAQSPCTASTVSKETPGSNNGLSSSGLPVSGDCRRPDCWDTPETMACSLGLSALRAPPS